MLLLIDNYDSFTHNLVHGFEMLGAQVAVFRHDAITVDRCLELNPTHIVLGPGPGSPNEAGICSDLIRLANKQTPLLGVCLGHQCLGKVFGALVRPASRIMHGKVSAVRHAGGALFQGLSQGFAATRYHSLIVDDLPDVLEKTAWTAEGEIMGIRHRQWPFFGIQFHPESILTHEGSYLLSNFLNYGKDPAEISTFVT